MPAPDLPPSLTGRPPLAGVRVAVTRDPARAGDLAAPLRALGAEVLVLPLVRIEALDSGAVAAALAGLPHHDWAVFTSRNGVELALRALGGAEPLRAVRLAAVGPSTAEALRAAGLEVALVPARHTAEGLLEAFAAAGAMRGARVLYVAAEGARDVLPEGLHALGAEVVRVTAYRTVADEAGAADFRARLSAGTIDVVTVAAPSAVRALVDAGGELARRVPVVTIGAVTTAAAREAGLRVAREAEESSARGLAEAVARWAASRPGE